MLTLQDFKITLKAIEMIAKGGDITGKNLEWIKGYITNQNKYVTRVTPNVEDFRFEVAKEVLDMAGLSCSRIYRHEKEFKLFLNNEEEYVPHIVVTYDIFIQTVRALHKEGISSFDGVSVRIIDPEIDERMKQVEATFDRKVVPTCGMATKMTIENTSKWFNILTSVIYREHPDVIAKMLEAYNTKLTKFNINGFEDYPVIDNRIYIPLSEADIFKFKEGYEDWGQGPEKDIKYIVISKNLYDYYFCSYGSAFQSCYSLNSDHKGCFGMIPFGIFDGHYIIYATKDEPQKTSIDGTGSKWMTPYMYWRCWGWTSEDGDLLLDKVYTTSEQNRKAVQMLELLEKLGAVLGKEDSVISLQDGAKFYEWYCEHSLRFYSDSIILDNDDEYWVFRRGDGDRVFVGAHTFNGASTMKAALERVTEVSATFDPKKPIQIINGLLLNPKKCPITNLYISDSDAKSVYAKYFTEPVNSLLVMSYVDGYAKVDAKSLENCRAGSFRDESKYFDRQYTEMGQNYWELGALFTNCKKDIKVFKETVKRLMNNSTYDAVLVRYVEGDKVTFVKYKKKGTN